MNETTAIPYPKPRKLYFDWVAAVLLRPRQAFVQVYNAANSVWLTPLLILSITAIISVLVAGAIKQDAAAMGMVELPPDFQYYSPEQQAQFQQAMAATQSPAFLYVLPGTVAVIGVWMRWLLVGGMIHLVLTLLGGRGETTSAMNLVAWASLPFAVRDGVRILFMLLENRLIQTPGLAGFVPAGDGAAGVFLAALLGLVDIYVIWHVWLLWIGVRSGSKLAPGKTLLGIASVILILLASQAGIAYLVNRLSGLTIIRPFF